MFADSLLESSPHPGHRPVWTKLLSAMLQSLALAVLLASPLLHIERLQLIQPPPSIEIGQVQQPLTAQPSRASYGAAPSMPTEMVQPNHVPAHIVPEDGTARDAGPVPPAGFSCLANCGPGSSGMADLFGKNGFSIPPPLPARPQRPLPVSVIELGTLVRKVVPDYPAIAKQHGIQGAVVLKALIGKDGKVEWLQLISGHPLLVKPALEAVEQWQYRPYLLNHEPVEVQTQITVNFTLNRN